MALAPSVTIALSLPPICSFAGPAPVLTVTITSHVAGLITIDTEATILDFYWALLEGRFPILAVSTRAIISQRTGNYCSLAPRPLRTLADLGQYVTLEPNVPYTVFTQFRPPNAKPGPELPIPPKTEEEEATAGLPRRILVELKERRQSPAVGMWKLEIGKDYVLCIAEKQEIGLGRKGTKRELWESGFWKNEKWLKMRTPPILVNEAKEVKFHVEMGQEDTARKEEDQIQRRLEMLSTRERRSKGRVTARSRNEHYAASSG